MTANASATSRGLGRPHPEKRACASASAKSNERARVSKDEDGRGMALMLRDASQRSRAGEASYLLGAAMLLSMRARRILAKRSQWRFGRRSHGERPTCGCKKWPPPRTIVSRLSFTMNRATCARTGTATDFGETNATRILAERSQRDFGESNFVVAERKS